MTDERGSKVIRYYNLIAVFVVLLLVGAGFSLHYLFRPKGRANVPSRLEHLGKMHKAWMELSSFLDEQKASLIEAEEVLSQLKAEEAKLKPIVALDANKVNALLAVYEERQRSSIWLERGYGLIVGIIGSLIASVIYNIRRNSKRLESKKQSV